MNKIFKTLTAILVTLLISFNGYSTTLDSLAIERDVQKSLTAKVVENNIYFNLEMLNESKPGMYSLVKTFPDGTFESVGLKDIAVNTINQPLLYSFVDNKKPNSIVTYSLIRVSLNVETVECWQYYPIENTIRQTQVLSIND